MDLPKIKMAKKSLSAATLPTLGLLGLAAGLATIFYFLGQERELKTHVPEFIALSLLAGALYLVGVYWVENFSLGFGALAVILGGAVLFRLLVLPAQPSLSDDVYRYQWEGRVQRMKLNPYTVFPALPELVRLQVPGHLLEAGRTTSTAYPPLSEMVYSRFHTVRGYKRFFTALDLAGVGLLLLLLSVMKQPLHRVLAYTWNPTVIVAFSLCGHHDSLAIVTLLLAELFIISRLPVLSIVSLALSALSRYFPALLLPMILKRARWAYAGIFGAVIVLGYLPYASAGRGLVRGLSNYAAGWEGNDSLFRLIRLAGNSKPQAELVAGVLVLGLLARALKKRMDLTEASLFLIAGLLFLSPNAFPWYFTWFVPFLCFRPSAPLLLMSVTAVLGYSPVLDYAAGLPYRDSPFMLALEYVPVYCLLVFCACRTLLQPRD